MNTKLYKNFRKAEKISIEQAEIAVKEMYREKFFNENVPKVIQFLMKIFPKLIDIIGYDVGQLQED